MAVRKKFRKSSTLRAINVLGDYWVLWIMREALLGARSYSVFYKKTGLTHSTLSARLKRIVRDGLLKKSIGKKSAKGHPEYQLTDMGRDVFRVLLVIREWERLHQKSDASDLLSGHFVHLTCEQPMHANLICRHCDNPVCSDEITPSNGPGYGTENVGRARMQRQVTTTRSNQPTSSQRISGVHAIIGDRWATMIMAATNWGYSRFSEYQKQIVISPHILSKRLDMLTDSGMLERRAYQQSPPRHEYVLTDKGDSFYPIIVGLMTFGDRWLVDKDGPPVILTHTTCGKQLDPGLVCDKCSGILELRDIEFHSQPPHELLADGLIAKI